MEIAFLTLFLGLTAGSAQVSLSAGPGVEAVELVLDGTSVARIEEPPWSAEVDFGAGLLPHHLVARALDLNEREVARAEQWINLPRPPAEVELVFEKPEAGRQRAVRLVWQSLTNDRPSAVSLTLDGLPLQLDGEYRAALPRPSFPTTSSHVLSAALHFPNGMVAHKDAVLASQYGDAVASELTALPVRLRKGGRLPAAAQMQGWFAAEGKVLRTSAVEAGPPHLYAVRGRSVVRHLIGLSWPALRKYQFSLQQGGRVRFMATAAQSFPGSEVNFDLFAGSQEFDAGNNGIPWLLVRILHDEEGTETRIADAVAVAGLQAAVGAGPRAVLLVLADDTRDGSRYDGPTVRRYLAAIHVPLFVWSATPPSDSVRAAWGAVEDVTTRRGLEHAFQLLEDEIKAQRIVLVEGRHLPQSITLSSAAAGLIALP